MKNNFKILTVLLLFISSSLYSSAVPTLSIADVSLAEGNSSTSNMTFTVSLSSSASATVHYATSDETATAGSDYTSTSGTLTFTSGGATTQKISVPILGDTVIESDETFYLTLSSPTGATICKDFNSSITVTVIESDETFYLTLSSPTGATICKDFNSSITVSAPLGVFNVVNKNFSGTTNSKTGTSSDNALYTQIVGQTFQVKVLALNTDYTTLKSYTGDVNLTLISQPNYTGNDTTDQALCTAAASITSAQLVSFSNESSKTQDLTFSTAYKNIAFKIAYNDNGTTKYICSRDSFAIRPSTYLLAANSTNLIGGQTYTLTANALTSVSAITAGYDQSITTSSTDKNATIDLIIPTGCTLDKNSTKMALSFASGSATNTKFIYNNVGDVNVTVADNNWTAIDQNSNIDCLLGSTSSTPDSNGKVGCLIQKSTQFTFSPKQFNNELTLQNFNTGNFTYIYSDSNMSNMSAKALLTTTAVLNDTVTTATNYTAKCYARDINYTLKLINNQSLSTSTTQNRIRYFEDNTKSNLESNATIGEATFSSTEGNFTSGIASNLSMLFNFTRDKTTADNPFKIAKSDFNITNVVDSNGTTGTDFNRTNDQNTTFYYGRVYSTDYRGPSPIDTTIRYEVYCKDCNKTAFDINGTQSPTSLTWYQNPLHVMPTDGNVTRFLSATTGTKATTIANANTNTISSTGTDTTHTLSNNNAPYVDRITMTPSSWLLYNPYSTTATTNDFNVEFISSGNWAGDGNLGKTVDVNTSSQSNKRIEW